MGTVDALFAVRILLEKAIEMQKKLYICFVDYEKSFDKVQHPLLIETLKIVNLDTNDYKLIGNLYWDQTATVRLDDIETAPCQIEKGVYTFQCLLRTVNTGMFLRDVGIKVGGVNINNNSRPTILRALPHPQQRSNRY
ncbi:uncharacterized protein LOC111615413 [Centruroides sculpturatus]|uniref:uncharacterized protein LOC111615413 n=1 Tax=Centruroides sculpturatus TaxID=218467 RepID=UPI000C6DC1F1|nr:uncharacterized protein LOC111615413 [Centruroides sculpturatus]